MAEEDLPICKGGKGLFLPQGGSWEAGWPDAVKVVLYLAGLCYCFLGVTIVSDIFMTSIERITSRKVRRFDKELNRSRTVTVWNDTVANLTLMALGSSAPEILLNVIEVFKLEFQAGPLGPSTIVGSAAFNLLGISAVCVVAIPNGEIRKIKDVSVYAVTASFSIFAYLWLLFILTVSSPHVVEVWEGLVTFAFFPMLIGIAFAADKGWLTGGPPRKSTGEVCDLSKEELHRYVQEIKAECKDCELDDHTIMYLVHQRHEASKPKSRARYRVQSSRFTSMQQVAGSAASTGPRPKSQLQDELATNDKDAAPTVWLDFSNPYYTVSEASKLVVAEVKCTVQDLDAVVSVKYRTRDGTAKEGQDYIACEGLLEFVPGKDGGDTKEIPVTIVDDNEWEEAENFFIDLSDPVVTPQGEDLKVTDAQVVICNNYATVTIIDDDDPGKIAWDQEVVQVEESHADVTHPIRVQRRSGSRGAVSCRCFTENDSAVAPLDYEAIDERITFEDGEFQKDIPLVIKAKGRFESTERLRLVLTEPEGCRLDKDTDGGEDSNICWVEIRPNEAAKSSVEWVVRNINYHSNQVRLGKSHWRDQFVGALLPEGSDCWEDAMQAKALDWAIHLLTCPWKLLFAFVPPTDFLDGWLCFLMALVGIGLITAVIGDLAELLGCALQMDPLITAITFVALGTSLPDTFASKTAAQMDPYADASIGNITGSNSVNVFLGLGMPWTIGAFYWYVNGKTELWYTLLASAPETAQAGLVVQAGGLGFSVAIFAICAGICMSVLALRRRIFGGELGGPLAPKAVSASFLVFLWLCYIGASWAYLELS